MAKLETIILYCLKKLNNERTIYSIFHLLNGKKSSQTIQDAHLFSLKQFYGVFETLTRTSFEKVIASIYEKKWIDKCGEQRYILTPSGELNLNTNSLPHYVNGWKYHHLSRVFWERLSFLIQVASNLVYEETRYIPIQKNKEVQLWVKSLLMKSKVPRKEIGRNLFDEVINCLNKAEGINPSVLVFRLTGYRQIGLTAEQTAQSLNMEIGDYQIEFINILHCMIHMIMEDMNRFPLLTHAIDGIKKNDELTISTRKTWDLFTQGYSIDMIAKLRQLKLSTIEDHFVELALNIDSFPIDVYVDKGKQEKILNTSRKAKTKQLKQIKEQVKSASYFQIKLVLAKYGDQQWT